MTHFMIRFLACNILIMIIVALICIVKRLFKHSLTNRMKYHLWFLLPVFLTVPFLPVKLPEILPILTRIGSIVNPSNAPKMSGSDSTLSTKVSQAANWMGDFSLSVNRETSSFMNQLLFGIWIVGILMTSAFLIKSYLNLQIIKKSALPLQNPKVNQLYRDCLKEMHLQEEIPIYSTAFFKSPVIVGLFKPCIYLPIHLILDCTTYDIRYIMLHELQHYKHKDILMEYVMIFSRIIYWFNPLIWYAWKEMRNDREIACDSSVLKMLDESSYEDYGNTLINFAEKTSLSPFPFSAGIGESAKQIRQRIVNISTYKKPSLHKQIKSIFLFSLSCMLLLTLTPALSTYAIGQENYQPKTSLEHVSYIDLSSDFGKYDGSFVLYNLEEDSWDIYDREYASRRVSPNSTYKIYDALFALEEGIITPEDSLIAWDGQHHPFDTWNKDQDLPSAMQSSVNWYFQSLNKQLGADTLSYYIEKTGYGNKKIRDDLSSYWMESSLKISPIEQVSLLKSMYTNRFNFAPDHINAVKDSIWIASSESGSLHGKTGTGRVNNNDVNGWFIGYIEAAEHTYFFATNIQANAHATGSNAAELTLSILSDLNIWTHIAH